MTVLKQECLIPMAIAQAPAMVNLRSLAHAISPLSTRNMRSN